MQAVRDKWTDERLDDMNARMGESFTRVDTELRTLRSDMRSEFASVRGEMSDRFETTQRLIIQVGAGLFGTMTVGFIGMVLTLIFTQH
jgi:hypothetical protein